MNSGNTLTKNEIEYIENQTKISYTSDAFCQNFELYWRMCGCLRAKEPWDGYWDAVKEVKERVWNILIEVD